jgi:hypothetical protein
MPKDLIAACSPSNSSGFQILGQAWKPEGRRISRMSSDQQKHSVEVAQGGSSSPQPIGESSRAGRGTSSIQDRLYTISRALNRRWVIRTKIPDCEATEMAKEARVFNQDADENSEHQRSCPCWYIDGPYFKMGVRPVCLNRLHPEE